MYEYHENGRRPFDPFKKSVRIEPTLACLHDGASNSTRLLLALMSSHQAAFIKIDSDSEPQVFHRKRLNWHLVWRTILKPNVRLPICGDEHWCIIPDVDNRFHVIDLKALKTGLRKKNGFKMRIKSVRDLKSLLLSPIKIWDGHDTVFAGFADGFVRGISLKDNEVGQVKFEWEGEVKTQPVIAKVKGKDWIFFGTTAGKFLGYDLTDGNKNWSYPRSSDGGDSFTSGVLFQTALQPENEWLAFGSDDGKLHCVVAETGEIPPPDIAFWEYPLAIDRALKLREKIVIRNAPLFVAGSSDQTMHLVFGIEAFLPSLGCSGRLCGLDLFKLHEKSIFSYPRENQVYGELVGSPQIVQDGKRVCFTTKKHFSVVELDKSASKFNPCKQWEINEGVCSPPLLVGKTVYLNTENGIYEFSTDLF